MLLYIHIPFCASKCGYCGFNSLTNMMEFKEKYLEALCIDLENELDSAESQNLGENKMCDSTQNKSFCYFWLLPKVESLLPLNFNLPNDAKSCHTGKKLHSIYIGGGTPNTLTPRDFEQIFKILSPKIAPNTEITMELNPNASPKETLIAFKDLGVNRFSIGVQSFCENKLKLLERNHSPKIARQFIENALNCGVKVSIDLIYDTILDSDKSLRFELENALNLGVGHISCYALSIDKNSAFYAKGKNPTRESSLCYELKAILEANGFMQYEVSNFAKIKGGHKSAHNLGYWDYCDYVGVGLGAVGKITGKNGVYRTYKNSDFGAYLANPKAFRREFLNQSDIRLEKIFLGFRSEIGVESALIANKNRLDLLEKSGKIRTKGDRVFATNYFVADEITLWADN